MLFERVKEEKGGGGGQNISRKEKEKVKENAARACAHGQREMK